MERWLPRLAVMDFRILATLGISHEGFTLTTCNENMRGVETGDHKGRPYNRFVGVYFRSNRSCRLSPTPPIMKMAVGGYFQRNDREPGSDHSCNSVLPTPVSPRRRRDWRFFAAALLRMTARKQFV